jgi:hypothetical protein
VFRPTYLHSLRDLLPICIPTFVLVLQIYFRGLAIARQSAQAHHCCPWLAALRIHAILPRVTSNLPFPCKWSQLDISTNLPSPTPRINLFNLARHFSCLETVAYRSAGTYI